MSSDLNEVYESRNAYEATKRWRSVFELVIDIYQRVSEMSPMVAANYDIDVRPRKLGPKSIDFLVDVENVTRRCLKSQDLLEAWRKIVDGDETVPDSIRRHISKKCGREYSLEKLHKYFHHVRQGRADRRPCGIVAE